MRKLILMLCISLTIGLLTLQAQQVISSGGADFQGENVSLSWTIGEPVIETLSNGGVILTQGFQQGYLRSNSIEDLFSPGISLKIYPNPTADDLNLLVKSDNFATLQFFLHNMEGKALTRGSVKTDLTKIEMYRYPHGVYLLRIVKKTGEPVKSFRIVKQ